MLSLVQQWRTLGSPGMFAGMEAGSSEGLEAIAGTALKVVSAELLGCGVCPLSSACSLSPLLLGLAGSSLLLLSAGCGGLSLPCWVLSVFTSRVRDLVTIMSGTCFLCLKLSMAGLELAGLCLVRNRAPQPEIVE